jgi:hypothetical protein
MRFTFFSPRGVAVAGVLVAALALGACGGGSSHSAGASPSGTSSTGNANTGNGNGGNGSRLSAFRSCMASHGVTLPQRNRQANGNNGGPPNTGNPNGGSGGGGGGFANRFNTPPPGVDATKYQDALNACRSQLPTGGGNFGNGTAFQAFRSCMSDHGVTLPQNGGFGSINRNDPKVRSALNACRALMPNRGNGSSTTPTTTVS